MGDEAEHEIIRRIGMRHGKARLAVDTEQIRQLCLDEGYKKGFNSARGQLLMQVIEWMGSDFFDWESPIWIAHVATEEFKCGCAIDADYDNYILPGTCSKWDSSTQEQRMELFQNVYGYPYSIWKARVEQERHKAAEQRRKQFEERDSKWKEEARQRMIKRLEIHDINPELLP